MQTRELEHESVHCLRSCPLQLDEMGHLVKGHLGAVWLIIDCHVAPRLAYVIRENNPKPLADLATAGSQDIAHAPIFDVTRARLAVSFIHAVDAHSSTRKPILPELSARLRVELPDLGVSC
jgi:hypothetical protein